MGHYIMIIESLRYLYVLFMKNELLKQYFPLYQQNNNRYTNTKNKKYNSINTKQSVNRGK